MNDEYSIKITHDEQGNASVAIYNNERYLMTVPSVKEGANMLQLLHEAFHSGKGAAVREANYEDMKKEVYEQGFTDGYDKRQMDEASLSSSYLIQKIIIGAIAVSLVGMIIVAAFH